MYYVQYEYLRGNLTIEQAFYLTLFLRCRSNDKLISDVGHAFGDAGINVWGVGFNLNNLGRIAKGLLSTLEREDNFKEIVREPNTDKIAYIGFHCCPVKLKTA